MTTFVNSNQIAQMSVNVFTQTNRLGGQSSVGKGLGAQGQVRRAFGSVTTASSTDATTVFYRMVRVPTNSIITKVALMTDNRLGGTITTFSINVGFWASTPNGNDPAGNVPLWEGLLTTPISDSFFAYQYDAHSAPLNVWQDITFQNSAGNSVTDGFNNLLSSAYPLWDAVQNGGFGRITIAGYAEQTQGFGYASGTSAPWCSPANSGTVLLNAGDPGGFVDIGYRNSSAMSATTVLDVAMAVDFITPY
jgi:hypothetical protein